MVKNEFYREIKEAELQGIAGEELKKKAGKGRSRKGMFEGDLECGELEIGEVSALIEELKPAGDIIREVVAEYNFELERIKNLHL